MIYTKRKDIGRYLGMSNSLDSAIQYLLNTDLNQLHKGRNEIDGDHVFANRFDYQTVPPEQAIWEGHIKYGDIHILLSGKERIGVANAEELNETIRKTEEDFIGFVGPVTTWVPMAPEDVLIVFPEDIHMVKVIDGESSLVEKVCFKFKI